MPSIGSGVNEIHIRNADGTFRIIYIATLEDHIYVLHAFDKKSRKTPQTDLELARKRLDKLRAQL